MRNIIPIILLSSTALFTSCDKDFLDQQYKDQFNDNGSFLTSEKEATQALTGVYNGWEAGDYVFYLDCVSDNAFNYHAHEGYQALGNGTATPTASGAAGGRFSYVTIRKANWFLENITKAEMNESTKKRYIAEARVIRAYRYLDLAILFKNVPLVTKVLPLDETLQESNTQQEILDFVVVELTEAAADLPLTYGAADKGRFTKGAALGFKARALAYQNKHDDVIQVTDEIIGLGQYSLFADYAGLFEISNENNAEILSDVQYIENIQGYTNLGVILPNSLGGWGSIVPTQNLVDAYQTAAGKFIDEASSGYVATNPYVNRDSRLTKTVVYPGQLYADKYHDPLSPSSDDYSQGKDNASKTGYNFKKYIQSPKSFANVWNVGSNIIVQRYAEILLLNAEAKIEADQIDNSVYSNLNLVRNRAGLPDVDQAVYNSKASLQKLVRNELRVELAGEGRRFFDLVRWKTAEVVMKLPVQGTFKSGTVNQTTGAVTYTSTERNTVENRTFDPAKNYFWPIPQSVIDNSKGAITQNANY
ncbi:RagB/SusD family nutrient uptake outer membrane protein [Sphingobacterium hungaricum]